MFVIQILRGPHLMLADAGPDNSLTLHDLVESLQYVMRLNEVTIAIVLERMTALELSDLS